MAALYKITKALAGGFKNGDIPMKDADGVVITSVEKQSKLWKTHFDTTINKEAHREVEDIPERDEDLLVNMDPPTANEVKSAIYNKKSAKAPGADGVRTEMLKTGGDIITETLTEILKEINGRRRNTRRLEDRTYRSTAKERKPEPLQKLERDHTTVHHQQSIQQSVAKRPNATQRTGRIQERKILRRTHIHPITDSRTMPGIENTVVCKLHRLSKGFRYHLRRVPLVSITTLRNSLQDSDHHKDAV